MDGLIDANGDTDIRPEQEKEAIQEPKQETVINEALLKQLSSAVNHIKKQKNVTPFLLPVSHANYPNYPLIVKNPMDISKIESKLATYTSTKEFMDDVNLIRDNCIAFNGANTQISHWAIQIAKSTEKFLDKKVCFCLILKASSAPGITTKQLFRPKRDIHAPSRDFGISPTRRSSKKNYPEFKFCYRVLRELNHKRNQAIAWPFLKPVDYVALNIPEYPNVITHPMDLSTIREKLDTEQYETADQFESDVRLMCVAC